MDTPEEPTACEACGKRLTLTLTQGRPELTDRTCVNSACRLNRVNQARRAFGPGGFQVLLGTAGITRVDHRAPSQGEDNCTAIARELIESLGDGFTIAKPCPRPGEKRNSQAEQGFDFTVAEPCGHVAEVQVTRVPEQDHFAAMAAASKSETFVVDDRTHSKLLDLVLTAVNRKTEGTPPADRARRILAIDALCPSLGFSFFLTGIRIPDAAETLGWRGIVMTAGNGNLIWLGDEGWPPCPDCLHQMSDQAR